MMTDVLALMGPSGTWFGCCAVLCYAVLCCAFYRHHDLVLVSWLHLLGNVVSVINNKHTKHGSVVIMFNFYFFRSWKDNSHQCPESACILWTGIWLGHFEWHPHE